uniref:Uncharacterized protein n=1 Tax=Rhizophagus irregularis (strain DAOM 181602 / DAOM 197198 / MUCL 43194) TaxID=747089 RepID=U9UJA1_RHIID
MIGSTNPKKKKSSTQQKGKIAEISVQTTSDNNYLDKHFAKQSHYLGILKDPVIYRILKNL